MIETFIFADAIVITPGAAIVCICFLLFFWYFPDRSEPIEKPKPKARPVKWGVYREGKLLYTCDSEDQANRICRKINPRKPMPLSYANGDRITPYIGPDNKNEKT